MELVSGAKLLQTIRVNAAFGPGLWREVYWKAGPTLACFWAPLLLTWGWSSHFPNCFPLLWYCMIQSSAAMQESDCQGKQQNWQEAKPWQLHRFNKSVRTGTCHISLPTLLSLRLILVVIGSVAHAQREGNSFFSLGRVVTGLLRTSWPSKNAFSIQIFPSSPFGLWEHWGTSRGWHFLPAPPHTLHTQTPPFVPGGLKQTINKHPPLKSLLPNWKIICWQCL